MAAATENQALAPPQTLAPDPFPPQSRVSALDLTAAAADPSELDLMDLGFSPLMSPAEEAAEDIPVPFTVGDFVWAKIKHHPWWPGRVYDPSQASERARNAHRKDHCLLVTFCGDDSFAWVEPSQLKHFTAAEFPELSKQNAAKNFVVAVADFADAVGLRLESELACHCIPEEARAGLEPDVPVSANSPFGFTPEEFLERLHTAACDALSVDMLDAAMVRGWGLAFGKGDFSSGSFSYHPQLEIGELVDKIDMDALSLDLFGEELDQDELRSPEDRVVKDPDVAEKKPYRTRKGRSATKIVTGLDFSDIEVSSSEEKAASKSKKSKKESIAEGVDGPVSGRRGRKAPKYASDDEEKVSSKGKKNKQEIAAEAVDVPGLGRRRRRVSKNVSEDEEKSAPKSVESKQENAAEAVIGSGSRRRGKKKSDNVSNDEVKVESSKTSKKENAAEAVDDSGSGRPERKASKKENAAEAVDDSGSGRPERKASKKENAAEAVDDSGSGRPERKASKKENAAEAGDDSGSGRPERKASKRENTVEAMDGSGLGPPERKASKKDDAPEAVVGSSSVRPERKKSKPVSGGEEKATPKSKKSKRGNANAADLVDDSAAGRRERKKSKYLSPPYTIAVGADQLPDSPTSTESETPKKAAGSLRPKSPRISKSVSSVFQEDDDDADDDVNDEDSKSPVYKIDSTSAADILSLFLAAAINPLNLKRHGSSRTVRDFFTVYRSAMYCSDSEFEDYKKYLDAGTNQDLLKDGKMDGKKGKKGGSKEETMPRAGVTATDNSEQKKADNSEQKKSGLKRKTRKDSDNAEPMVDLNRETADSPEEGKSSQKKKKVKEQEPMSSGETSKTRQKITKGNKGSTPKTPTELLQKNETDEDYSPSPVETQSVVSNGVEVGKPGPKRKKEAATTNEGPAALLLTFAPGITLPSKENLVATFKKYGDLIESETDSVQKSGCARVVFVKSIDAEKAFNSRNKTKEFGSAVPSYRLCPLSGNATSPPRQTTMKTPLPSIKKGLQRMISNLMGSSTPERDAGSSDGLLPEVREDLVDEMKGLLAKVDKMLKGPASIS